MKINIIPSIDFMYMPLLRLVFVLVDEKTQYSLKFIFDRYPLYDVKILKNRIAYERESNQKYFVEVEGSAINLTYKYP